MLLSKNLFILIISTLLIFTTSNLEVEDLQTMQVFNLDDEIELNSPQPSIDDFKIKFNKTYQPDEDFERQINLFVNFNSFKINNKLRNKTYKVGITQFSDMLLDELADKYLDLDMIFKLTKTIDKIDESYDIENSEITENKNENDKLKFLYEKTNYYNIDWRNQDIFLPVRNQGDCGACWAFATTGTIESHRAIKFNLKKYLSPQQMVDCDSHEKGCKGGWPSIALNYAAKNGIVSDQSYPYHAANENCKSEVVESETEATIDSNFNSCEEEECMENDYQYKMLEKGPVAIVIDAYNTNFFNYKSGIYDEECGEPNHAIMLVGYGENSDGEKYWIIRNSWGDSWGMNGYGYVKYDMDNNYSCNINRYGFQPNVLS